MIARDHRESVRAWLAAPVVLLYWLLLVGGLGLYSALRAGELALVMPLWIGVVAGTAVGHYLALRDFRPLIAVALIGTLSLWATPFLDTADGRYFLMAFLPAAVSALLSLGDRGSLAAFWFPVVLWMLSILDRSAGATTLDGSGAILLGGVALLFIVFLRARESRRIALWRTYAAVPLAGPTAPAMLRESPGARLGRAGWALVVSAVTLALTAWIAPRLWQLESFGGGPIAIAGAPAATPGTGRGLPCCSDDTAETTRSRVKEYFDLGRGRDDIHGEHGRACVPCDGHVHRHDGSCALDEVPALSGGGAGELGPGGGGGPVASAGGDWPAYDGAPAHDGTPPAGAGGTLAGPPPELRDEPPPPAVEPAPPPVEYVPARPPPAETPAAAVAPLPAPSLAPQPAAPTPAPAPAASPEPATTGAGAPPAASPAATIQPHRPAPVELGSPLVRWLAVLAAAAVMLQLVSLALRPVRRLVTLRHLRRPLWPETVDQRISNWWQLVLVGLRDAGWRASTAEPPREFARRVGVDGVERCATILERARHGIGLDSADLADMGSSAESAYRSGRRALGPLARALSWLRWPLT